MRFPYTALLLLALALVAGCDSLGIDTLPRVDDPTEPTAVTPERLDEAEARWDSLAVPQYSFEVRRTCFCPVEIQGPFVVSVRGGEVALVTRGGEPVDERPPTIDGLFDLLRESIPTADSVTAAFDDTRGFPTKLFVDPSFGIADEEIGYTITGFRPD